MQSKVNLGKSLYTHTKLAHVNDSAWFYLQAQTARMLIYKIDRIYRFNDRLLFNISIAART